jgi:hypothetical protein
MTTTAATRGPTTRMAERSTPKPRPAMAMIVRSWRDVRAERDQRSADRLYAGRTAIACGASGRFRGPPNG